MFEIKFPKDVRKYKEKVLLGLTLRQFTFAFLGLLIGVPIYVFGKRYLHEEIIAWITMLIVGIFFGFGWGSIDGLRMEQYLLAVWESHIKKSKKRYYLSPSLEEHMLEQAIKEKKAELMEIEKQVRGMKQ